MKKILIAFLLIAHLAQAEDVKYSVRNEDITFDWLVEYGKRSGVTDHISHFKYLFNKVKVKTFLEFGLGLSTKYFLDFATKVISIEFVTEGVGPDWMKRCLEIYKGYSNWVPIAYFSTFSGDMGWAPYKYVGSDAVNKAAYYQTVTHKNYALIDKTYYTELNSFLEKIVKFNSITVAFVDPGIYLRGDMVQILFNKIPIITAHDTNFRGVRDDVYGYNRVVTPENYEEIFIPGGQGFTIWVQKKDEYKTLIEDLKNYALNPSIVVSN